MSHRYETIADVIEQHIRPALGDQARQFDAVDLDAIACKISTYKAAPSPSWPAAGFEVDDSRLWAAVAAQRADTHAAAGDLTVGIRSEASGRCRHIVSVNGRDTVRCSDHDHAVAVYRALITDAEHGILIDEQDHAVSVARDQADFAFQEWDVPADQIGPGDITDTDDGRLTIRTDAGDWTVSRHQAHRLIVGLATMLDLQNEQAA